MAIRHWTEYSLHQMSWLVLAQDDDPAALLAHQVSTPKRTEAEADALRAKLDQELAAGLVPGYEIQPPWIIGTVPGNTRMGPHFHRDQSTGTLHLVGSPTP